MNTLRKFFAEDGEKDSPGAGGGLADNNAQPRQREAEAAQRVAGHPGNIEHAAGMHGQSLNTYNDTDEAQSKKGNSEAE